MAIYEVIDEEIPCPTCNGVGTSTRKIRLAYTAEQEVVIKEAIDKMPPKETNEP